VCTNYPKADLAIERLMLPYGSNAIQPKESYTVCRGLSEPEPMTKGNKTEKLNKLISSKTGRKPFL
jgi:hypothetical protein